MNGFRKIFPSFLSHYATFFAKMAERKVVPFDEFYYELKFILETYFRNILYVFKYIFFVNFIVIQLKLLKDLAQISLPAYGDYIGFGDVDKRRTKNKCKKTFTCFSGYLCCARYCDL
jgi:hypothetical protein